jgi:hypothetical protein
MFVSRILDIEKLFVLLKLACFKTIKKLPAMKAVEGILHKEQWLYALFSKNTKPC